jgi:thymidylate kinase
MRIVVDGNDGTGKSTLVAALRGRGVEAADRGLPTKMSDDPTLAPGEDELYLILDAPVEVCRERLRRGGKDLAERYHTVDDLTHYRERFLEIARLPQARLIDASGTPAEVLDEALRALDAAGGRR